MSTSWHKIYHVNVGRDGYFFIVPFPSFSYQCKGIIVLSYNSYSMIGWTNILNYCISIIIVESRYSKIFFNQSNCSVSFGGNLSSMMMKFKLVINRPEPIMLSELRTYYAFEYNSQNRPVMLKIMLLIPVD